MTGCDRNDRNKQKLTTIKLTRIIAVNGESFSDYLLRRWSLISTDNTFIKQKIDWFAKIFNQQKSLDVKA